MSYVQRLIEDGMAPSPVEYAIVSAVLGVAILAAVLG